MTPAARLEAAITLLASIIEAEARPADAVANDFFRLRRYMGSADRRTVSDQVWQVLRRRRRLGWWLEQAALPVTSALLLAADLVLHGTSIEALQQLFTGGRYAPVRIEPSEAERLAALQNAALNDPRMDEATALELPDWLIPYLRTRFGDQMETELAAMQQEAPLDLRVNLLKNTRDQALTSLRAEGLDVTPTRMSPWGLRIMGRRPVTAGATFQNGLVEIQDEGSQMLAQLVDARPEMRVLDYCAGAGGKTLAMAMTMNNRGHIIACDVSAPRLEAAARRLKRAGIHNVERHVLVPGDKWAKRRTASFDRVLVDAPCTGTGTWRRNPDARLRLTERDLTELVAKQAAILQTVAPLVKPGGHLIYATCSLLREENEGQIKLFLSRNSGFTHKTEATLSLTPYHHGTDGFYGAVLERAP